MKFSSKYLFLATTVASYMLIYDELYANSSHIPLEAIHEPSCELSNDRTDSDCYDQEDPTEDYEDEAQDCTDEVNDTYIDDTIEYYNNEKMTEEDAYDEIEYGQDDAMLDASSQEESTVRHNNQVLEQLDIQTQKITELEKTPNLTQNPGAVLIENVRYDLMDYIQLIVTKIKEFIATSLFRLEQ